MLPEAVRTGQVEQAEAERQVTQVLAFVLENMDHHNGLLYHFCGVTTGKPLPKSEVSALDSAIFFNGCMVAAQAFGGRTAELADTLLDRADWTAFEITKPETGQQLLALGWSPQKGLLGPMDVRSSEMAMPYFLAVGSRTHPIDPQLWWNTKVVSGEVSGRTILNPAHPLFTSYYGLGWHRLEGLVDKDGVDFEVNACEAALANRQFCQQAAKDFRTYRADQGGWWGISAGDSPKGYVAPGPIHGDSNGTVWPTAALATIAWIPQIIEEDLDRWYESDAWNLAYGPYGLCPFNLDQQWVVPPKNSVRVTIQRLTSSGGIGTLHQDNRFQRPGKIRSWGFCGGRGKIASPTVCSR